LSLAAACQQFCWAFSLEVASHCKDMRLVAAAAVFLSTIAGFFAVDVENGVLILDDSNFATALGKFPVLMVDFYDKSGQSKELLPSFEQAAKNLKKQDPPIRLAKVDATSDASKELTKKYEVTGFPTVIAFKDGSRHSNFDWAAEKGKQEIMKHGEAVGGGPNLFKPRIFYETSHCFWKLFLRKVVGWNRPIRKFLYWVFPGILGLCILLPCCCIVCCRGGSTEKASPRRAEGKKKAGATSDPDEKTTDKKDD